MTEVDTMQIETARRRCHDAELKSRVLAGCHEPGASVAAIARAHGLDANLVHKWRRRVVPTAQSPSSFSAGHVTCAARQEISVGLLLNRQVDAL